MSREVVRNMAASVTHLADVEVYLDAVAFGRPFTRPGPDTQALCGVHVKTGVVMRPGTTVKCAACRHVAGAIGEVNHA